MRKTLLLSGIILSSLIYFPAAQSRSMPLPGAIKPPGQHVIVINHRTHAWGAYMPNGRLVRYGLASAGSHYCRDIRRPCRTKVGSFRIFHMGDGGCYSSRYPLPHGGAPMPFCMYFNGNQALHGSPHVVRGNISHGCVRMRTSDARWLRFNFATYGTRVVVWPY